MAHNSTAYSPALHNVHSMNARWRWWWLKCGWIELPLVLTCVFAHVRVMAGRFSMKHKVGPRAVLNNANTATTAHRARIAVCNGQSPPPGALGGAPVQGGPPDGEEKNLGRCRAHGASIKAALCVTMYQLIMK